MSGRLPALVAAAALALLTAGCTSGGAAGASAQPPTDPPRTGTGTGTGTGTASQLSGEVTVLAAASLTTPLTALAEEYEALNPATSIRLGFGSSVTLAQQVAHGADADLLATAGSAPLDQLGDVTPTATTPIARNTLEIATPPGNPGSVSTLADLARTDVDVVLCAESVPCGAAADEVLAAAGVAANVVSREVDVSATLAKVLLGEAEAAVVYHSDVVSARGRVTGVEIPAEDNATLTYPLARFGDDPAATAFAAHLAGPDGLEALVAAGFLPP